MNYDKDKSLYVSLVLTNMVTLDMSTFYITNLCLSKNY